MKYIEADDFSWPLFLFYNINNNVQLSSNYQRLYQVP